MVVRSSYRIIIVDAHQSFGELDMAMQSGRNSHYSTNLEMCGRCLVG